MKFKFDSRNRAQNDIINTTIPPVQMEMPLLMQPNKRDKAF